MKDVTFQAEHLRDVWEELLPLLATHYEEVAHYQDIPLSVERAAYEGMADLGILKVYTARAEGELIGYGVFIVKRSPHYNTSLQAVQDVVFVAPEYRHGAIGTNLLIFCDVELRKLGVQVVYHHVKVKPHLDFGPLLERNGYELIDKIYGKRLDQEK
jgi:hypothetical protein